MSIESYASKQRRIIRESWREVTAKADALDCATCQRRLETGQPYGPPHTSSIAGHRPHCSCDGCY